MQDEMRGEHTASKVQLGHARQMASFDDKARSAAVWRRKDHLEPCNCTAGSVALLGLDDCLSSLSQRTTISDLQQQSELKGHIRQPFCMHSAVSTATVGFCWDTRVAVYNISQQGPDSCNHFRSAWKITDAEQ